MAAPMVSGAGYLRPAFAPNLQSMARNLREVIKGRRVDTLIGTGLSGALVVPYLGRALRKNWGLVRKPGDSAHSPSSFEGSLGRKWIMVDDLIDTGRTVERVTLAIRQAADRAQHATEFLGVWGYDANWGGWYSPEELIEDYGVRITP